MSAPESVAALRTLVRTLEHYGVDLHRVELDLGFGRGIGFYSQMIFELIVPTPRGPVEVCGGGRYDGLARVLGSDRDDRGVGFAFGLERLLSVLHSQGAFEAERERKGVLILVRHPDLISEAVSLVKTLLVKGYRAVLQSTGTRDDAMAQADRRGLAFVAETNDDSAGPRRSWTVYNLRDRSSTKMPLGEVWEIVLSAPGGGRE